MKVDPDLFLVGELSGIIIATVMGGYDGHRGWVNYLAASPHHRKKRLWTDDYENSRKTFKIERLS